MSRTSRGMARLGTAAALLLLIALVIALAHAQLLALIKWIDFLAPSPGLGGIVLLGLSPVAFLLLAYLVRWVAVCRCCCGR